MIKKYRDKRSRVDLVLSFKWHTKSKYYTDLRKDFERKGKKCEHKT